MNQNKVAAVTRMRGERGRRCTDTNIPPSCFSGGTENEPSVSLHSCRAHQENRSQNTSPPPTWMHKNQADSHNQMDKHVQTSTCALTHGVTLIYIHTEIISELGWHLSPNRERCGPLKQHGQTVSGLGARRWITFILRQFDSPPGPW